MTKGDYIRRCDNKELATVLVACTLSAIENTVSALEINIPEIATDEVIQEMLATCEKALGEEMP